jgi:hypothetical protein
MTAAAMPRKPAAPPAIPSDIPRETWNLALRIWAEMRSVETRSPTDWCEGDVEAIAREILAAQERGKLMERERCAGICDLEAANARFQSFPHEALGAVWCARAIRNPAPQHVIAMEGDV